MSNSPTLDLAPGAPALLGFVRRQPRHGYEIYRQLTQSPELRPVWRMKQSRLYALLARLEEAGLLRSTAELSDGRPPRKVFHLTAAGAAAFDEWLARPVAQPREIRLEFMLKLYFALQEGGETAARLIARQRAVCDGWLVAKSAAAEAPFAQAVAAYRRAHVAAIGAWLEGLGVEEIERG
jgi:DNA-binding PadR family transcriptional regulator